MRQMVAAVSENAFQMFERTPAAIPDPDVGFQDFRNVGVLLAGR